MKKAPSKKRNRLAIMLLAPAMAIVFGIGWSLYYLGQPRQKKNQKQNNITQPEHENVQLVMIPQEEQTIAA